MTGDDYYTSDAQREHPKCRYCGTERVMWLMHKNHWRLCDNETGELHTCAERETARANARAVDDFTGVRP